MEQVQRRATKMIKGAIEYLPYRDRLREQGLFCLERRLREELTAAFQNLKGPTGKLGRNLL